MASPLTRSSRRSEGLTTRSELTIHQNNALNRQKLSNTNRRKRPRDAADHDQDAISAKKARVTIEIESRPQAQLKKRSLVIAPDAKPDIVLQRSAPTKPTTNAAAKARVPTKYAEKVANGFKHELDRLQPSKTISKDEKRTLRSQEGTRFKSELSAYFPDYDVVIGNEPEETRMPCDSMKKVWMTADITRLPQYRHTDHNCGQQSSRREPTRKISKIASCKRTPSSTSNQSIS